VGEIVASSVPYSLSALTFRPCSLFAHSCRGLTSSRPMEPSSTELSPLLARWMLASNGLALFIAESSRGLFISGLLAYLEGIVGDGAAAASVLAVAVSLFSVGRLAAAVILPLIVAHGWSYRMLLILTFAIQIIGHGGFLLSSAVPRGLGAVALAVASRAVVGFGSGTLPTCRAVIADGTSPEERTQQYSWLSFAKYAGYALCPGVSILLAPIGGAGTAAWLSIALCVLGSLLVSFTFPARSPSADSSSTSTCASEPLLPLESTAEATSACRLIDRARSYAVALWNSLTGKATDASSLLLKATLLYAFLNFASKGALAVVEATLAPQYADTFGPQGDPDGDVDQDTAELALGLGVAGLVAYFLMAFKPKQKPATGGSHQALEAISCRNFYTRAALVASELDVWLLLASLLLSFSGALLLVSYDPERQAPPFSRLVVGYLLVWSVGAPILDVLTVSCLSVMLSAFGRNGPGSQASEMGYLSVAGALGRIILPALAGTAGPAGALGFSACACAASATASFAFYVAYPESLKSGSPNSFEGIGDALRSGWGLRAFRRL